MEITNLVLVALSLAPMLCKAIPSPLTPRQSSWPPLFQVPDTESERVFQWRSQIDWSQVPQIPITRGNSCNWEINPENMARADEFCWWSCSPCTRATDFTVCPNRGDWGLTFDDGPSAGTARLLDELNRDGTKATFFVVGSQATTQPDILRRIANEGHQLGIHTWSHTALTTLSNEQIVAELGWTRDVLNEIVGRDLGVTLMRPPYGDIDDRVRGVSNQMGLKPTLWTPGPFDTKDYQLVTDPGNQAELDENVNNLVSQGWNLGTGFITLQHDLHDQTINWAISNVLPRAKQEGFQLKGLWQCGIE